MAIDQFADQHHEIMDDFQLYNMQTVMNNQNTIYCNTYKRANTLRAIACGLATFANVWMHPAQTMSQENET